MAVAPLATASNSGARLNRRSIPNLPVTAHDGTEYRFYDDLVRDQTVLIGFMSITHDAHYPSSSKMAAIGSLLDQAGDETTRLLSITVDPEKDQLLRLAEYAGKVGAGGACSPGERPRWLFLHASADHVEALRAAFYVHRGLDSDHGARQLFSRADLLRLPPEKAVMDCSMGLLRYGNEALDIWGGAPVRASAEDIASRLRWVRGADMPTATRMKRRRGGQHRAPHRA